MRPPTLIRLCFVLACLSLASAPARAAAPERGFLFGFGAGGGSASVTGGVHREGGTALALDIGYALSPAAAVSLGTTGWTHDFDGQTVTFSVYGAEFAWFPGAGGLELRAMAGLGRGQIATRSGNTLYLASESGLGLSAGASWQFRLARTITVGPQVDFNWVALDDATLRYLNGYVACRWYPVLRR